MDRPCDVCSKEPAKYVCAVPYMPISMGYCQVCASSGAHPYHLLLAQCWMIDGIENANEDIHLMIERTCRRLGKTKEDFEKDYLKYKEELDKGLEDLNR